MRIMHVLNVVSTLLAVCVCAADAAPEGLIASYACDGDATDASGLARHAVNHGARPCADGRVGGALAFDGATSYLALPASATENLARVSLSLWVLTRQHRAAARALFWKNPTLLGVATPAPGSRDVALIVEDGRAGYHHGLCADTDTCFFSEARIDDGAWHHIVLTNDGNAARLYVDGGIARGQIVLTRGAASRRTGAGCQTRTGAALGPAELFAGACNDTSAPGEAESFFEGALDAVQLWSRVLTAQEIGAMWSAATGLPAPAVPPAAPERTAPLSGAIVESLVLGADHGVAWRLDRYAGGWALGAALLEGTPLEGPIRSGAFALLDEITDEVVWFPAARCERIDDRSARITGSGTIDGATLAFQIDVALRPAANAVTFELSWSVDKPLAGRQVRVAWHEDFTGEWFCHLYPYAEDAKQVTCRPLAYVGVPAALLCREDGGAAVLFGLDARADYLNPTTWTGTTGFRFENGRTPPELAAGGEFAPDRTYRLAVQLIATDARNRPEAITQLVRAWIALADYKVEPLFVRTPDEALAIYLEGRRATDAWKPGRGYVLQPGAWNAIYLGTTPASAYFEYRIYELTGDELWRTRAFEQLDFTLKAQNTDAGSPNFGAFHTAYDLGARAFDSNDRGNNRGYKPDLNAHMVRYMLRTWQRVKAREGLDREDWRRAATRAADWVLKTRNDDGGLPQKVDETSGARSHSVVSARALAALPEIAAITGDARYAECAAAMERFVQRRVEDRMWFTGQHPDLPPGDMEADSVWGVIEYRLDAYARSHDRAQLERAVADALLSLLWWCPKQLSWVKNPTQCAHTEQQNYLQYSLYCYHNRKLECLRRLADTTGDPLFAALYDRVLQCVFWTQQREGNLMGAMYERIADPWNARREGYDSLGTLYLNELSLDAMLQLLDMGVAKPPARR